MLAKATFSTKSLPSCLPLLTQYHFKTLSNKDDRFQGPGSTRVVVSLISVLPQDLFLFTDGCLKSINNKHFSPMSKVPVVSAKLLRFRSGSEIPWRQTPAFLLITRGRTAYLWAKMRIYTYKHINILKCLAFEMLCQAFAVFENIAFQCRGNKHKGKHRHSKSQPEDFDLGILKAFSSNHLFPLPF